MRHQSISTILFAAAILFSPLERVCAQTPPYSGTIFIEPDIITSEDCSTLEQISYVGTGQKLVYDRRDTAWVVIEAYLFDAFWNDSLFCQVVVNPEFTLAEATAEANKYAYAVGQLPYALREDVDEIWIHKGNYPWGGGNRSILVHTGMALSYESQGIVEETLVHEASHTSLDADHALAPAWVAAQISDSAFISTYAQQYPDREDIAESFLVWLAVRHRAQRITTPNYNTIVQTIPNRLLYFDAQAFNLHPIHNCPATSAGAEGVQQAFLLGPNPTTGVVNLAIPIKDISEVKLYSMTGQAQPIVATGSARLDISQLADGVYYLAVHYNDRMGTARIVKISH